jgi:hypothetical protein
MNLRDRYLSLREPDGLLRVASPMARNNATTGTPDATPDATAVQQMRAFHREPEATSGATVAQLGPVERVARRVQRDARCCASCRHRSRVGTCREPVAAGLLPEFAITWPEPGHGATCKAWSRSPAQAIVAVFAAAGRDGWPADLLHQWLRDADQHPEAVLDVLSSGGPKP